MFLKNCWYVAAWDYELLPDTLMQRTICGESIVFFRTTAGAPVALDNRCCHRHAPLHLGRKEGDCVRCMYHGLKYDASGRCVEIPGQESIPIKLAQRSYSNQCQWSAPVRLSRRSGSNRFCPLLTITFLALLAIRRSGRAVKVPRLQPRSLALKRELRARHAAGARDARPMGPSCVARAKHRVRGRDALPRHRCEDRRPAEPQPCVATHEPRQRQRCGRGPRLRRFIEHSTPLSPGLIAE